MNLDSIGWLAVNQLGDRYQISKSIIYKRMSALKMQSQKIGNRAYLSAEQLAMMDALHKFIKSGGSTAEFLFLQSLDSKDEIEDDSC